MFSKVIQDKTREIRHRIPLVNLASEALLRANLRFAAQVMRASEDLMQTAMAELGTSQYLTGFEAALLAYLIRHAEEERDHYQWIMEDLNEVAVPDWLAAEAAGAQYYMIRHVHPASLLGYMAVLEGDPPRLEDVTKLEHLFGKKLLRCTRLHAATDLEHRIELFKLIDMVPANLQSIVLQSAEHTLTILQITQKSWEN